MNFLQFQILANRTAKTLEFKENLRHVTYGLCGEAGEFADAIKKHDIYDQELNVENALEELGDVLWYVALGAEAFGVQMEDIADACIKKLQKRYPEKYSDDLAKRRLDKLNDASEEEWDQAARSTMTKALGSE
jgi:NTP pyrophosphatase (non-canonical NTP hydrolase)